MSVHQVAQDRLIPLRCADVPMCTVKYADVHLHADRDGWEA